MVTYDVVHFPRDASQKREFLCFTKFGEKKVDFCTLVFVRTTTREQGTGPMSCNPSYYSYIRWIDILIDFCVVIMRSCLSLSLSKGVLIVESWVNFSLCTSAN